MKQATANQTKLHFDWYPRQSATPVVPAPQVSTTPTPTEETPTPTPEASESTQGEVQPTQTPTAQNTGAAGSEGGGPSRAEGR